MERRMKISPKFIIILAVLLLIATGLTAWLSRQDDAGDGTSLSICRDGEQVAEYSLSEIMDMRSDTVYAELQSAKADDEKGDFTGVRLDYLLETAGVEDYDTVVLTAGDGYSSALKSSETGEVLIAYFRDGETLGYYTEGGQGPMRAIFTEDVYGNRSVKFLVKVDCK